MNTIDRANQANSTKNVAAIYPLTPMQQGMLFHTLYTPESTLYFEQLCCTLQGELDVAKFAAAWQQVADRHAVLRTAFIWENINKPLQVVGKVVNLPWVHYDWRSLTSTTQQAQFAEFLAADRQRGFMLSQAPLMRFTLMRVADNRYKLVWSYHHLLIDGWSLPTLMQEVFAYYEAAIQGEMLTVPLPRPYRDYVLWREKQDAASANRFWQGYLQGVTAPTPLPIRLNALGQPATYRAIEQQLSATITTQLQDFSRHHQLTLNTLFQGVWALLLSRYSGESQAVFGATISGRPPALPGVETMVGLFINTVPVKIAIPSTTNIVEWLKGIQLQQLETQSYDYSSLVDIQGVSEVPRGLPLFETLLVFENYPISESLQELEISLNVLDIHSIERTNYPLTLVVIPSGELTIQANYDASQFERSTIERMLGHFQNLLLGMATHPESQIHQLPLLTASEVEFMDQWQNRSYSSELFLHQRFEQQVARRPNEIAIVCGTERWSYAELNQRANQLANHLRTLGVTAEVLVGLCVERSLDTILGIIAILKAGGAYVPLDPDYPAERLDFMASDAQLGVILTQSVCVAKCPQQGATIVVIDRDWSTISEQPTTNLETHTTPENLAYIIYTSGSTGQPKGVLVTHHNVLRLFASTQDDYQFSDRDVWTMFHSYAFDFSVWEIWGALIYGGRLVVVPFGVSRNPQIFSELLLQEQVTVLNQTPSAFLRLMAEPALVNSPDPLSLRWIIFGGEALDIPSLRPWFERFGDQSPQLVNMYGITETTVHVTYRPITQADVAAAKGSEIGRPIGDLQIYVLDAHLQRLPVGVAGEMYVGGDGLARGYLNRPELTAERFISNPFQANGMLYKTGDLAKLLPNGELEYLGRIDHQVKIRGFRIELGEIEAILSQHPDIMQTVVVARSHKSGQQQLAAYLVAKPDASPTITELRQFLGSRLPDYMIPAAFVTLLEIPLTTNGKIDKKALPVPDLSAALAVNYVAPQTELEKTLAAIWVEVLGVAQVGTFDNFFELGGHSLIATQLISRIRSTCKVELSLHTLFTFPTIAALAVEIDQTPAPQQTLPLVPIDRSTPNQHLPLSFAQQRLWFLQQLDLQSKAYHIPGVLRLYGKLDISALQQSLQSIVQRHESLRTNFATNQDGQPHQVVQSAAPVSLPVIALQQLSAIDRSVAMQEQIAIVNDSIFDLTIDPLLRTRLLQLAAEEYLLLFCMHHIISDGWSMGVIVQELAAFYSAAHQGQTAILPPLSIQYADFAHWQRQLLAGELRQQQLQYWQSQLANLAPCLELPTDRPRPAIQTYHGATLEFSLNSALSLALEKLSQQTGSTLFMTLLAAFQVLLTRYTGQTDIAVGSPIANRNREEIEHLIGFFVNTLVLRTDLAGQPTFRELLQRVRKTTLAAYEHQDLPFELVVEALQPARDLSHSPLFQIMFVLQNAPAIELQLPDLTLSPEVTLSGIAKFDLTLALAESAKTAGLLPDKGLTGAWEYNTDLFDAATIARMSEHFIQLLTAIVSNPDSPIAQLSIVSPGERAQLILGSQGLQQPVANDRCIHELIAAQAIAHPQATAVVWGDQQLTYAELDARANQLANYLRGLGVRTESIVGICVERSLELIIGLLGILKVGGAYVPIDHSYPSARIAAILTDTQMPILLTQSSLLAQLPESQTRVICLDADWPQITAESSDPCFSPITAEQLAYVVYTSGSTGIPKGVMIPHRGLLNLVAWHRQAFEVTAADRATQLAGIAFDAAGWEIWPYLAAGATLHLVPPDLIYQPADLRDWLLEHEITLSFVPTPVAEQLFNLDWPASSALRMMLVGGDRLATNPAARVPFQVVNNYGPTENSVVTTSFALTAADSEAVPTIGRPISNTQVYCFDAQGQIAPLGVPGELWLGGDSLARGYLNRPELTAEAFINHPELAGARLYRSGDRGRYLANGQIEYLGRMDQQVKIRGFRIELGEIETVLNQHSGLLQAVVIALQPELAAKVAVQLVAYIVPTAENPPTVAQLRQLLADRLPDYMIPAYFVTLATLPLTANGKVDRRALPAPDLTTVIGENYVAPQTAIETQLAQIWAAVLGLNQVGVHDNFFGIGGDSILSLQIVARASQAGIQITPKQLFSHQSIAELAAVAQMGAAIIAEQGLVVGEVPLAPIQQWYFEQNWPEPQHFNQTILLQIPASVSAASLQTVLAAIFYHHDALRLKFELIEGRWQQAHADLAALPQLQVVDLGDLSGKIQADRLTEICSQHQASFDLAVGCLLKATLFQMGLDQPQRLLLAVHHLAVDGVSWRILLDDIQMAFQQVIAGGVINLPVKTTAWQQWAKQLTAGTDYFAAELDYWQRQVAALSISLPTDRSGENTVRSSATVSVGLSRIATQDLLQKVPAAYRTQINDVLIAALAQTICDWIGATKIPLTLEGHGREELFEGIDISRTVGWFTTMFPVCLDLSTGQEPGTLLKTIKEQLRQIPHKGIGYGLLRYVRPEPSLVGTPSAPLSFNYLGQFDQILNPDSDFQVAEESAGADISLQGQRQHLLDVNGLIVGGELQLNWTYSENLYDHQTIDQLAHNCLDNLIAIITHCMQPNVGSYTPSDFPLASLNQEQLDYLAGDNWREVVDIYPLSPMQQGMLFHSIYVLAAGVYVVQLAGTLQGALNRQVFAQAWQQVIDRYEVFRTSYRWVDVASPLQVIHRQAELPLIYQDWRDCDLFTQQAALTDLMETDRQQGFDLGQAPLMRLHLIQLADDRHQFIWSHHHLLLDGWSFPIVLQTVFANYDAIIQGLTPTLAPPPAYRAYIAWLQQQDRQQAAQFWQQEMAGLIAPTALPTRKSNLTGYGEVQQKIPADLTTALQNYARQHQLTVNTAVQGAWALLLSLYSGEREVLFGATVAGRPPALPHVETMVGLFINTLPVRVAISDRVTVTDWLRLLQDQHQERDRYAYTPLVDIQGWSEIPRGMALFDSIIVFENYPVQEAVQEQPSDLQILAISGYEQTNYPLTVTVIPGQSLTLRLSFDRSCFAPETISQMGDRFHQILTAMVAQPTQPLASLTLLSAAEQALLTQFQQGAEQAHSPLCFHQLFEAQVARTPQATALVFEKQALTYQALNEQANQLAHHLQSRGVGPEVLVGISLERNLDLVVGLLGILKAGGAYVPLDPSYPSERLAYMVGDAQLSVLLTQASLVDQLPTLTTQVVQIDADWPRIATAPSHNPDSGVQGDHLAYVIYTSGSTGQPKGVQIPQSSVSNFLQVVQQMPGMTDQDVLLAVTTISFDIAVLELYLPLITGAQILMASRDVASDGQQLSQLLTESGATMMQATPATWQMLIAAGWQGSADLKILCGGEALSVSLAGQLLNRSCEVWNMYGPTEATVWATIYQVLPETIEQQPSTMPIGKPLANIQTYILNAQQQPVPIGIRGELYIGGDCLARGYLNRPELTGEKFIADPFSPEPHARLYKTGDAVRYLPTGEIEYLNRLDNQVKLRGFRIELGEIEAVLSQHPEIQQAIAIIQTTELDGISHQQLIAYVVATDSTPPTGAELRQFLAQQLPPFMIPSFMIPLTHLPLTPNGKVDRRALPVPDATASTQQAPQTALEIQLADLWTEILRVSPVSRTDNFFALGGHSLLATQLLGRIRSSLQIELPLRVLFAAPSLAALAEEITTIRSDVATTAWPPLVRIVDDRPLALSYAQQRMWFLHQLDPQSATYHMPGALRLQGQLVVTALTQSLQQIGQRQASLRTTFPCPTPGEPIQSIAATVEIPVPLIDLQQLTATHQTQKIDELTKAVHHTPFNLTQDCLLRVQLLQLAADDYLLLFCMHHIISDGWSIEVLTQELAEFYDAAITGQPAQLPELKIRYSDFAQWQRQVLSGDLGAQQLHYWQNQLADLPPLLELPTDRPRPPIQTFGGSQHAWQLDQEISIQLEQFSHQVGATLFMTLLAAFQVLLYRYSGQTDVAVGSPIANRNRSEVENLLGFFVNTLVLRTDLSGQPTFRQVLAQVREMTLSAYEHQDLPFELVVEALQPERDLSHTPLFQVMLVLQNNPAMELELPGVKLNAVPMASSIAKFDITLNLMQTEQGLEGIWEYNTDLFEATTIARMGDHFQQLLRAIVGYADFPISQLPLISTPEQAQLAEWQQVSGYTPSILCLPELFEQQVACQSEAIAVIDGDQTITYGELNARANQLACYLQILGVTTEVLVGLCMERSIDLIVSVIAILKAGGAYVPLDPTYPPERLAYMLEDTQLTVLLTQVELFDRLPPTSAKVIGVQQDWAQITSQPKTNFSTPSLTAENLAYIIYTSGSTGQPKGVMVNHGGITRLVLNTNYIQFSSADRVAQAANTAFDAATFEIWGALLNGAQLVVVPQNVLLSPPDLIAMLAKQQMSILFLTPALFNQLASIAPAAFNQLRYLIMGGEALDPHWVRQVFAAGAPQHLLNGYGPTESTTFATYYEVQNLSPTATTIPIGRPLAHTEILILDSHLQPVPIGVPGELYIGGTGLARGYWQQPELTAAKFIPHPYKNGDARLYKTGDLVRYLPSGDIDYLDRIDQQVKIRGFRIEMGEIEAVLGQHPEIRQAVVAVQTMATGQKQLIAYVATARPLATSDLRQFLATRLPDYMIPLAFVPLDELPLTPNGKVDKRALPLPDLTALLVTEYVAPETELEVQIAEIWANLLGLTQVGISDNFFELGGHSLLVTQFISRVHHHYQVAIPLQAFFMKPTIRDTAQIILEMQLSNVAEEDFLARTLAELAELSDEDVQKLLAQDDTH